MPVGGGHGSLKSITKVFVDVAKDPDIEEEFKEQIIDAGKEIVVAAVINGYKLETYD